jgi:N-acetylglucosamine-6-phosphate deacetylase
MTRQAILAPFLFDGEKLFAERAVLTEGARISAIVPPSEIPASYPVTRPPGGAFLAPGLVDLQVNGGGGVLFNDSLTIDGISHIAAAHRALGTSCLQPTVISAGTREIATALDAVRGAIARGVPGILGLHVEGPFLAPRRRGIHPPGAIRALTTIDLELLTAPFPGRLIVTLAPEMVPRAALEALARAGVIVLAGHTEATAEQIAEARDAGLAGFTHLFNAMPPIAARAPGPAGAALAERASFASVIADGVHVHPETLRLAVAAKGTDRIFLVSDAMPTVGSPATSFRIGDARISLRDGRLLDGAGTLGGAHLALADAVRNAHRLLGLPPAEALRMATATPAACLGLAGQLGSLRPGARADLALFDASLDLIGSWSGGVLAPRGTPAPA